MRNWVKIDKEEFSSLKNFMEAFVSGFGLVSTYTNTEENYAFTVWGANEIEMIKTIHSNGVNDEPDYYKRAEI